MLSLAQKVATLLALTSAQRIQTLARIRVQNIIINPEGIEIFIPDPIKTTSPRSFQPHIKIPFFFGDPSVCVAEALMEYIKKTAIHRNENQEFLFLTSRVPFVTASTSTISGWIKRVLANAGIDINKFSAYSVKHAATSTAFKNGILLSTIRRTACWSEKSEAFPRFYQCPIDLRGDFSLAVLKS